MKGLRRFLTAWSIADDLLESSPVYEGIKTKEIRLGCLLLLLESSPVYEGIKTHLSSS